MPEDVLTPAEAGIVLAGRSADKFLHVAMERQSVRRDDAGNRRAA